MVNGKLAPAGAVKNICFAPGFASQVKGISVSLENTNLLLNELLRVIIQDGSEAILGHHSLRIQTEV